MDSLDEPDVELPVLEIDKFPEGVGEGLLGEVCLVRLVGRLPFAFLIIF
jgi:hypothetical protein